MTAPSEFSGSFAHQTKRRLDPWCRLCAVAGACVALSACSTFNSATEKLGSLSNIANIITPYKVEVVQGNFVSKEQKEALQNGMQRAQVRDILGSPLVASAFHADRWDYVFTIRRQGQEPQQRKLTVFFKGDELAKVESDALISEEEFVTSLSAGRKLGKVPLLEVPAEVLREFGIKSSASNLAVAAINSAPSAINSGPVTGYPPLEAPGATTSAWDASTQRGVAASASASSAARAPTAAPLLTAQAPVTARPAAPSIAPVTAPSAPVTPVAAPISPPASAVTPAAPSIAAAPPTAAAVPTPAPVLAPRAAPAAAPISPPASAVTPAAPSIAAAPLTAAAAPTLTPTPAPAPPTATRATPPPEPAAPSTSTLANADAGITALLNGWTTDWQARNAAAYFSHYLPEFKGTSATRQEWEALRRTRIEGRSRISLAALDVRVRMVSPTEARLVFRQEYESDAFREIGTKAMFLVKRDGRWLIEREFFTPLQ